MCNDFTIKKAVQVLQIFHCSVFYFGRAQERVSLKHGSSKVVRQVSDQRDCSTKPVSESPPT